MLFADILTALWSAKEELGLGAGEAGVRDVPAACLYDVLGIY